MVHILHTLKEKVMGAQGSQMGRQVGNYRLLQLLGRGGFAEVYLGEHIYLKSRAAIKLLHTVLTDKEQEAFLREAQTLVRLRHLHIVRVLEFAFEGTEPFLVMDYAPHGTLRQRYPRGTKLDLATVVHNVQQVASALQYAHDQRLIHRDIKPENMLLGQSEEVLLSDFGLAMLIPSSIDQSTREVEQALGGTAPYLSPEQIRGGPLPASDQYALGVITYEWLCGSPPFHGTFIELLAQHLSTSPPSLRDYVEDIPAEVEEVVLRALAKEPRQRFARVQDFADALEQAHLHAHHHFAASSPESSASQPLTDNEQAQTILSPLETFKSEPFWNVPVAFTSLIGREQDVTAITTLLRQSDVRLLTLLGAGGIGKTRLSLQVAIATRNVFTHGVCFVSLAAVTEPSLVMPTIAAALGLPEVAKQTVFEQVAFSLREKHLLLVLDNFEQIVESAAELERLLSQCPSLTILVTSRIVLHVQSERNYQLAPLALPPLDEPPTNTMLETFASVALFVERAQAVVPAFRMTPANAPAIAELCVRLDGLPLALELAAARVKLLSPQALLARLSQRFQLLTNKHAGLPVRQQALRNTIQWSYELLDEQEQLLFRRLSVFAGSWALDAAERMCADMESDGIFVLDGVESLLDKSLLQRIDQDADVPRFQMLITVREFGQECLREYGEFDATRRLHALYYLAYAEQAEPLLQGSQQLVELTRLEQEHDNIRAALQWLIEQKETELALRFCVALEIFWLVRGHLSEGRRWCEAALGLPQEHVQPLVRAKALCRAGTIILNMGEVAPVRPMLLESVQLLRPLPDAQELAFALECLGHFLYVQGEYADGVKLIEECISLSRESGAQWVLVGALRSLGIIKREQNDFAEARVLLEECAALCRTTGNTLELANAISAIAFLEQRQGNNAQAIQRFKESLAYSRMLNDRLSIAMTLNLLGFMLRIQGDEAQGNACVEEALRLARKIGYKEEIAQSLDYLSQGARTRGDLERAAALATEALTLRRETGHKGVISYQLSMLGEIVRDQGDLARAEALFREGLTLGLQTSWATCIGWNLVGLGTIATARKKPTIAARLFGAAEDMIAGEMQSDPELRATYEARVAHIRSALPEAPFLRAWAEGRAMTPEQAFAAFDAHDGALQPYSEKKNLPAYPDELTEREVEVLRLLAQGWTDAKIADYLVISPRTVNRHTTSIYSKIGVSSRTAATRYALEKKLV